MDAYAKPEKRTLLLRVGKRLRKPVNAILARNSKVGTAHYLDHRDLPWVAMLERNTPAIRGELEQILKERDDIPPLGQISPDHRRIAHDQRWRSFFLEAYGYRVEENRARCPKTSAVLDQIPDLVVAFFSIMEPHAHVPRHRGVTKALINIHLGLIVPTPPEACRIAVNDEVRVWREGEVMIFDDTFPHEVWNETDQPRAVLLIQVKRPVRLVGKILSGLFLFAVRHSSYVQEGRAALGQKPERKAA